jgi:hypothetical protein
LQLYRFQLEFQIVLLLGVMWSLPHIRENAFDLGLFEIEVELCVRVALED